MESTSAPIPQPAGPEELRAALALLAPHALRTFDAERAAALQQARDLVSAAPLRRFTGQWAVYVAIERHPERADRLRRLEARAAETDDLAEVRAITSEIGRILDVAFVEAGIAREDHGTA
ncbi:hypothetical protein LE181_15330 [Streptomyces sp. SCA3-4]|uniref:hypothetical protein n=1 Tax=Streptomyces sichuanensis TaxID=2871810 RepID=UPI001CE23A55|nr:hypothetical protein [Streptomyces sichuanensis]MCA6093527.1 hypothetical protein [Streptomyces sichuanensis]